jgi:hypothetical protein
MYSDRPVSATRYEQGTDPLAAAPFFDPDTHYAKRAFLTAQKYAFYGGMRERVFGFTPCLSKIPLFRYDRKMSLFYASHFIRKAEVAGMRAALLHFKYMDNFYSLVKGEIARECHWDGAREYKAYDKIKDQGSHSLYYGGSARFESPEQLVRLGIMEGFAGAR